MNSVTPIDAASSAGPADAGNNSSSSTVQQAFADGIVQFMAVQLQSAESDVAAAINDNTSDPDAPS
jgi:hypothetical protein